MFIGFMFSITTRMPSLDKPFNPILGETLQGHYSGDPFYLEQISHHPPITVFSTYGDGYKTDSTIIPDAKFSFNINKVELYDQGKGHVYFDNTGNNVTCKSFGYNANGMLFGDKTVNFIGYNVIYSVESELIAFIKLGLTKNGKHDYVTGSIYSVPAKIVE